MSVKILFQVFAVTFAFAIVQSQDFNPIILRALCTREFVAPPRNHSFPLRIEIYPDPLLNSYQPNQNIRVTLRGIDPEFTFAAFVIFARPPLGEERVGRWSAGALGQPIDCKHPDFIGDNAAGQRDVTSRRYQELVWTTPSEPGNYILELTTSQEFTVYWVDQLSHVLRVV